MMQKKVYRTERYAIFFHKILSKGTERSEKNDVLLALK